MRRTILSLSLFCSAILSACGGETAAITDSGGSSSAGTASTGQVGSTTAPTTGATATVTDSGGSGAVSDSATGEGSSSGVATDGASTTDTGGSTGEPPPKPAICGDGVLDDGEACDDGNDIPTDGCTNLCTLPACGDGVTQMGEDCDAGADNGPGQACKADCTMNVCGDGDKGPGEGCDDGNMVDDDACGNDCALASCGDGKLQMGEQCDDGNLINTDACTNACTDAACGDGFQQGQEQCDKGNDNSDNGDCTSACKNAFCGDSLIWAAKETCDDGLDKNGPGQLCNGDCQKNVCGDGDKSPLEECDVKNGTCTPTCKLNKCGDKFVGAGETCDDGNFVNGDGCSMLCQKEVKCGIKLYKCGNGLDDDKDGKIDLLDPECTSPCDDDEGSYQTLLPGQNMDCKSDCYWDADSGVGNDNCQWNLKCDKQNPGKDIGCAYNAGEKMCTPQVPQLCLDVCVPLIPNGCDCFGCCQIAGQFYYLNSNPQCNLNNLAACNHCTFFPQCANPCDKQACEVCFGEDVDDLPPECNDTPKCDVGVTPCETLADCPGGQFCQTGCCVDIVPQ